MKLTFRALMVCFVVLSVGLALCCRNTPAPSPIGPAAATAAPERPVVAADRPAEWAQPVARPGLENLHLVAPHLYRGAQPKEAGFRELKAMGIKTVINLRNFHTDTDRVEAAKAGLNLEEIPMNTWQVGEDDAIRFLRVVTDKSRGPFFVHCQHGADRTGTMIAVYRIVICDWTKERAFDEMRNGNYGFHEVWKNLPKFLESLDADKLRRASGITPAPTGPATETPPAPTPGALPT
jgi:protein tyrosine phosphatase (PTP) superfamily phosphohydrolase (DUF442 family)